MYQVLLTGGLDQWALGNAAAEPATDASATSSPGNAHAKERLAPPAVGESETGPKIQSLMLTPGISELETGHSQQFSAIAVLTDGKASDATSKSMWRSSGSEAVVSTAGLVTALAPGQVTISVRVFGALKSRQLLITTDEWTLWSREP